MAFALSGARIFTGEAFLDDHAVVIDGPRIAAVIPAGQIAPGLEVRRLEGGLLAPGFIDVQVNGGGGALLNDDPTVETVRIIAASHRRFGTVGMLPTVITDAPSILSKAIGSVASAISQNVPGVLGIHVEGPFLDIERKGAHAARFIREMTANDIDALSRHDCGRLMLTLAPNKVPPALVKEIAQRGILVSLGHAEATYAEAIAALKAGASAFTHLFNAMSQMSGREPGMAGAALSDRQAFVGIIADGFHVHDAALRVAFSARPRDRMMLITDAMPTAAGGPSTFELQGRRVELRDGRLQLEDGTLAGSNLTMDEAVRHCVNTLKLDLGHTLNMASLNPAAFLGLDGDLGRIAAGHLASLVHLDDELKVRETWIGGA